MRETNWPCRNSCFCQLVRTNVLSPDIFIYVPCRLSNLTDVLKVLLSLNCEDLVHSQ